MDKGILCALALASLAAPAQASHLTNYATNPVEHDDQGRSHEPDFEIAGMLGVADCTVDVDGDGGCTAADLAAWPAGRVVAQGCTDKAGRQPSGLCGAQTLYCDQGQLGTPPPVLCGGVRVPEQCMSPPPPVRFLDTHVNVHLILPTGGTHYIEVNGKLRDSGLLLLGEMLGLGAGGDAIVGPTGIWAWHGIFQDKNCNHVIDHRGDGQTAWDDNEFTWLGNCLGFAGTPGVEGDVCRKQPTTMLGWEFPGNHHAYAGPCATVGLAQACSVGGADTPGSLVLCTLMGGTPEACDADEAAFAGDPLLGPQDLGDPDFAFSDRTGDPEVATRMWVAGFGWPLYHYDHSVLVTTVLATQVNPGPGGPVFVDVDHFASTSPAVDALLQGTVKPTLRANWLVLRELL